MQQRYEEYSKLDLAGIEAELKNWFIQRRFAAERNLAIKKTLDDNNFTGLSMNNPNVSPEMRQIWGDLTRGKPEVEDSLSKNARIMKAELYLSTFQSATDLDHPCRTSGSAYLRCLGDNALGQQNIRDSKCNALFPAFAECRKEIFERQKNGLQQSLTNQDIADRRAKALFERRSILLDTVA